jgi:F-type H+-transporting ATPase subunit delta
MADVAVRYARALLQVVTQPGAPAGQAALVRAELRSFLEAFELSAELRNVLVTPAVPAQQKRALIERLGQPLGLSRISLNFLFVLLDHRRISLLSGILQGFEHMLDVREGIVRADVTTATGLEERQQGLLTQALEGMTGKRVRARFAVDPALLGGALTRIGSTIYDGSVRGQLRQLRERLAAE